MKVLYFHQHFSTPSGATGTRSYEMARRLIEKGHKVCMVCGSGFMAKSGLEDDARNGVREGWVDGIHVIEIRLKYSNYDSLTKRSFLFLRFALTSVSIAWKKEYDLLFATSTPLTAGIPGIVMRCLKPRKKFVFEVRDLWPELPKAMKVVTHPLGLGAMSLLEKVSYAAMHAGVALSPGIREGMRKRSAKGKPIALIPNGCDTDLFRPLAEAEAPGLLSGGIPKTGLRCVFTGAHGLANGLDAVLDAAAELKKRGRKDIHLIFIGDGKLKPHLVQRAETEGLENCRFMHPTPKASLAEILRQLDIGLMILDNIPAFYFGTSPNKFFDYLSCGMPILNNYPGWLAEIIEENSCGKAVPPDDPGAFADALEFFADHPDVTKQMGRNCRALAESRFSRADLATRFVSFLERVHLENRG